jgi:hypothetical protein
MSEKLNAVALAIADALGEGEFYMSPAFQKAARAAVVAMRKPTAEMVEQIARALCSEKLWPGAFEKETDDNQDHWRSSAHVAVDAMIDEILR